MTLDLAQADAVAIANAVRQGQVSAVEVVTAAPAQIEARDKELNCFIAVTAETALASAEQIEQAIADGVDPAPLAGVLKVDLEELKERMIPNRECWYWQLLASWVIISGTLASTECCASLKSL